MHFSHPSFSYLLFFLPTPSTHQKNLQIGDSKPTNIQPAARIIMIGQSEIRRSSQIIFTALFFSLLFLSSSLLFSILFSSVGGEEVLCWCVVVPTCLYLLASTNYAKMMSQNHFAEPN